MTLCLLWAGVAWIKRLLMESHWIRAVVIVRRMLEQRYILKQKWQEFGNGPRSVEEHWET